MVDVNVLFLFDLQLTSISDIPMVVGDRYFLKPHICLWFSEFLKP